MAGRGSLAGLLPYSDANMGLEVLQVVQHTLVLAGVYGTDLFRIMDVFLKQLKDQGFAGAQNFPAVGLKISLMNFSISYTHFKGFV